MPIIKSAVKRMRQTATRYARNLRTKRNMRSAVKSFSAQPSNEALSKAQSELDKAVKKGIIKKNTASRRKAQLVQKAKAANVKPAAKAKATSTAKKPATKKPTTVKKAPTAKKTAAKAKTTATKKEEK